MAAVSLNIVGVTTSPAEVVGLAIALFGTIPTVTAGGASVARTLKLAKNGVVANQFPVRVRVTRAEWFRGVDVAHVRPAEGESGAAAVLDFGIPRTVSAVSPTESGLELTSARRWLGASFEATSVLGRSDGIIGGAHALTAEVRTERLQVTMTGASSFAAIKEKIAVKLPEIAADLELRIDGAAPVWTSPGAATAGDLSAEAPPLKLVPGRTLNGGTRWVALSPTELIQDLDLADVLTALLGDPSAGPNDEREITIVLSARVPGAIGMETPTDPASFLRHRAMVTDGFVDGRRDVRFATEGVEKVPLVLPSWASAIHSATCTIAATCDAKRTLPPDGPRPATLDTQGSDGADGVPLAEFVLDSERSISFPIRRDSGLESLTAVRVPLRVGSSGCEIRAVLLGADTVDPTAPGLQLDGGAGKPTTLEPAAGGREQWATLEFPTAFTLPPDSSTFVALHFVRGSATMAAARSGFLLLDTAGMVEAWRGPPSGPWEALPDAAGLRALRGRLRLTGTAPSGSPIAPLRVALASTPRANDGVTPSPKGVPVELTAGATSTGSVELRIAALTPCTVSVRDVVVTVSR